MQIGSNSLYDIGSSYTIKLGEKQILVIEDDPLAKAQKDARQKDAEEQKLKESQEASSPEELSSDEKRVLRDLSSRDTEVRAHESAHQTAAGGLAGAASYTYQQGPDGKMYAIGGEVPISTPSSASPEEAIQNARKVASAALAAGDPSPQDFAVASSARVMEMQAEQQKTKKEVQKQEGEMAYANQASLNESEQLKKQEMPTLDLSA